jgi:hypothetical protein
MIERYRPGAITWLDAGAKEIHQDDFGVALPERECRVTSRW